MKSSILTLILIMGLSILFDKVDAQAPNYFNYQAVIRDANNNILDNQQVSLHVSILKGSPNGNSVYLETHIVTTNDYGIVSIKIGDGFNRTGSIGNINWSDDNYFIKTELDLEGGDDFKEISTFQLVSVPYALHAKTAENAEVTGNETVFYSWDKNSSDDFSGDYNDLSNKPTIPGPIDGEESAFNDWDKNAADDFSGNYNDLSNKPVFSVIPVGTILPFAGDYENIPDGWLLCDGTALKPADYPELASVIKTYWGNGSDDTDPLTTFNLPDLRGQFLRGADHEAGEDPNADVRTSKYTGGNTGDKVGSFQDNATLLPEETFNTNSTGGHTHNASTYSAGSHTHTASTNTTGAHTHSITENDGSSDEDGDGQTSIMWDNDHQFDRTLYTNSTGSHSHTVTVNSNGSHTHTVTVNSVSGHTHSVSISGGDAETRPQNAYVNYIIKY